MLTETELITLKSVRYSDSASIVHTYSERFGSLSFKVTRTRSRKRSSASAFFMPLSLLSVTLDHQPKREIHVAKEVQLRNVLTLPSRDPSANAVALFSTELLNRVLRVGTPDDQLYQFVREQIVGFDDQTPGEIASFHLRLIVGLLFRMGIQPHTETFKHGFVLDLSEGVFRAPWSRQEADFVERSEHLYTLITSPSAEGLPLSREQRNALLDLLLRYLAYHFPDVGTLRSPDVLSQLF